MRRVADPDGVYPDPDPTLEKNPGAEPDPYKFWNRIRIRSYFEYRIRIRPCFENRTLLWTCFKDRIRIWSCLKTLLKMHQQKLFSHHKLFPFTFFLFIRIVKHVESYTGKGEILNKYQTFDSAEYLFAYYNSTSGTLLRIRPFREYTFLFYY